MAARLTPDQKVGRSTRSGLILCIRQGFHPLYRDNSDAELHFNKKDVVLVRLSDEDREIIPSMKLAQLFWATFLSLESSHFGKSILTPMAAGEGSST